MEYRVVNKVRVHVTNAQARKVWLRHAPPEFTKYPEINSEAKKVSLLE